MRMNPGLLVDLVVTRKARDGHASVEKYCNRGAPIASILAHVRFSWILRILASRRRRVASCMEFPGDPRE